MSTTCLKSAQRGVALFTAIFILVALATLAAAVVSLSGHQHMGAALDVQGSQAYQAARSGLEWGLYKAWKNESPCNSGTQTSNFGTPLGSFSITVQCAKTAVSEAGGGNLYTVTAWACNQPVANPPAGTAACPGSNPAATGYVERKVRALIEK